MNITNDNSKVARMENLYFTGPELYQFLVSRPNVRKEYCEAKRCQDIYYKINCHCLAETHKFYFRNKIKTVTHYINREACISAMQQGLIPAFHFLP